MVSTCIQHWSLSGSTTRISTARRVFAARDKKHIDRRAIADIIKTNVRAFWGVVPRHVSISTRYRRPQA